MAWYIIVIVFLASCFLLSWLSERVIGSLASVARYLGWREFVIAFFVMSFAISLPNLFIDLGAALQGKPELGFGDIIGGNLGDLTVVLALAVFFSKKGLSTESSMVQTSALYMAAIAVLPLLLVLDGSLGRLDGLILIGAFFVYAFWLFSKKANFKKAYRSKSKKPVADFKSFMGNIGKAIFLLALLLGASQLVVSSAQFFATKLNISLGLVGILIVGLGNCFPEAYFSIISARKEENWLVLGDLMGSVIVCATLVLGLIGVLFPFTIVDFTPFVTARLFLIIATLLALLFIKTGKHITKKEGLMLLGIYVVFLLVTIAV